MKTPPFDQVLTFWFQELTPKDWFSGDLSLDLKIKDRFLKTLEQARRCELFSWRSSAQGRLAEVIVLDQFSRNVHRGHAESFASDALALALSQEAISLKLDLELKNTERSFLYMPFMHSESILIHEQALKLFDLPGLEKNLDFERRHKKIIDQFGRYPHRNAILGRKSTPDEIEFLKTEGSSF